MPSIHMLAWTSAEILTCSYLLESNGMMVVRHLIILFSILFLMMFFDFSCICPNDECYGMQM